MRLSHRHFPHPVLSEFSDDIPGGRFDYNLRVQPTQDGKAYELAAEFSLTSKTLSGLISSGQAVFGLHLECPGTRYRTLLTTDAPRLESTVELEMVDGEVQVNGMILASTDLERYTSKEFNPDYGELSFRVRRGDILALGKPRRFYPNKLDARSSIFVLARNPSPDPPQVDYKLNSERIVIYVPDELLKIYRHLDRYQENRLLLHSMFILPVLVSVLHILKRPEEVLDDGANDQFENTHSQYRNRRWYRILERGLRNLGIRDWSIDNSVAVANELLQHVLGDAVVALYEREVMGNELIGSEES